MAQIDDLKTAVTDQSTAITEMQSRVAEDVAALEAKLAEQGVDSPEVSEIIESIRSNTQQIETLDPVVESLPDGGEVTPPTELDTNAEPETPETPSEPADGEVGPVDTPADGEVPADGDAGPIE